jgi:hypothetical protein
LRLINGGKNGDKISGIRKRLPAFLASTSSTNPADTLYIIFFDSDISDVNEDCFCSAREVEKLRCDYRRHLSYVVSSIKEHGHEVLVSSPGLLYDPAKSSMLDDYSRINLDVATQNGSQFIDVRSVFLDMLSEGVNPTVDGEHLNTQGCEKAAQVREIEH